MIVVMAEVGYSPTLSHIIFPEHIENPISWCEMVIAWHDIHNTNHEMTISHHNCRYSMYNYEIGAKWSKIQKADGVFWRLRLSGDDGIGSRKTSFPSCRLRHHHSHDKHDFRRHHGQKAAFGRKKSPAHAGKKRDWLSGNGKRVIAKQKLIPNLFKRTGVYPCCV